VSLHKFFFVYLDDILISSGSKGEHLQHIRMVLEVLDREKLQIYLKKCEYFK
jgi:hypothetical protein